MEDMLKDVNAVPGVTGCFLCGSQGDVLASALPAVFDAAILSDVARTMNRTIAGLATARRRKVSEIHLVYEQNRLITKNLTDSYLCILCIRSINLPLLNVATDSIAKKVTGELIEGLRQTPSVPLTLEPPVTQPVNGTFFDNLQKELARAIGPMATLVLDEAIEGLGERRDFFPAEKGTQLVEKLSTEIPDEGKRLRFAEVALAALQEQTKRR
jgi:predicted regulator of Ras-like GTPase activity (Roadblock/LC7/MglB family)